VGLAEDEALTPLVAGRERERLLFASLLGLVVLALAGVAGLLWQGHRDQAALARSERRYRALMDFSPDGIFLARDGRFVYANPATLKLLGADDASQLVGRPVFERIHPDTQPQVLARREQIRQGAAVVPALEERYLRLDGTEVDVEVTAASYRDEQGDANLVIVRDTTERRRAARALQQLADDLEHRVQQRTAELERARDEAERANRAKSEFLSRMSHELRTPLNAILGFGQLLELELLDNGPRAKLAQILAAGHHLLALVNDVLDLARIEAGQFAVGTEPVLLEPLVADALALMRPQAEQRRVQLAGPVPGDGRRVQADPTRLRQVLLNLLSNAIKYNQVGGQVQVRIEDQEACWRLVVADTGPGLDEAQCARLFVSFERLDAAHSPVEGTGIGLALSRRLVELMGGRIGVHSTPGQGSRFWLDLPKAPEAVEAG
jgi:PAS domain S-box-containing protein